jgi:hypothetical protein
MADRPRGFYSITNLYQNSFSFLPRPTFFTERALWQSVSCGLIVSRFSACEIRPTNLQQHSYRKRWKDHADRMDQDMWSKTARAKSQMKTKDIMKRD